MKTSTGVEVLSQATPRSNQTPNKHVKTQTLQGLRGGPCPKRCRALTDLSLNLPQEQQGESKQASICDTTPTSTIRDACITVVQETTDNLQILRNDVLHLTQNNTMQGGLSGRF